MSNFFLFSNWNLHLRRNKRDIEADELSSLLSITPLSPSPSRPFSRLGLIHLRFFFGFLFFAKLSPSTPLPFNNLVSFGPFQIQGFLWKIAWRRVLTEDRYQTLNPLSSLCPHIYLLCLSNSESNDHFIYQLPFYLDSLGKVIRPNYVNWVAPLYGGPHL